MSSIALGKVSITPRGEYNNTTQYDRLDIVSYKGCSYLVLKPVLGVVPMEGEYYMNVAQRGFSGLIPKVILPWSEQITLPANKEVMPITLMADTAFNLGEEEEGYSNEWDFSVKQSTTAYNVTLPTVNWGLGIAPTFEAGTTTLCRLYKIGEVLCGEWVSI